MSHSKKEWTLFLLSLIVLAAGYVHLAIYWDCHE